MGRGAAARWAGPRPQPAPKCVTPRTLLQAGLGVALSRRVSCLLSPLCPQVPLEPGSGAGPQATGTVQAGEDSRPLLSLVELGLAYLAVTRRHNPSWVGPLGRLGGPGVGLSFAGQGRGGDKGPEWTTQGPSRGLSAPSWSGWAGWGPSWLLRAAHHPPRRKLNCRGAGQARRVGPARVCSGAVSLYQGPFPGAPPAHPGPPASWNTY